jgi:hypothetical protein
MRFGFDAMTTPARAALNFGYYYADLMAPSIG